MQAPVSKLLAVPDRQRFLGRPGRSLKALGGHPLAFTNVGQYWGRYGRVVRSSFPLIHGILPRLLTKVIDHC